MMKMMGSCEKAGLLAERKMDGDRLRMQERMSLRLHMKMCAVCQEFKKQADFISTTLKNLFTEGSEEMSVEKKGQIQEELNNLFT